MLLTLVLFVGRAVSTVDVPLSVTSSDSALTRFLLGELVALSMVVRISPFLLSLASVESWFMLLSRAVGNESWSLVRSIT